MDRHRPIEVLRQNRLVGAAEIAAPFERLPFLAENLHRLVVRDARERRLHGFELRRIALEHLQLAAPLVEHARHDGDDEPFGEIDHVVERRVRHFGLDHPELGEMPPRLRFLGAEYRPEVVDAAERHRVGLGVQLAALREEDLLILEIVDREQRRRALARRRREDRRVGEDEAVVVEEVAHGADHFVPHAENRLLTFGPNPEMAAIEQVVDAVFLRRNRIIGRAAHDLEIRHVELVPAGRAAVRAHRAVHDDRGFLRQVIGLLEFLVADGGLRHDRLNEPRAVAHRQRRASSRPNCNSHSTARRSPEPTTSNTASRRRRSSSRGKPPTFIFTIA